MRICSSVGSVTFAVPVLVVAIRFSFRSFKGALSFLDVGEVEVVLPGFAVMANLPCAGNGLAVIADGAGVALGEIERREVRFVAPQLPDSVLEAHPVDAGDAARVEVVLKVVALALGIGADDRDPVRRLRYWDLPALDQEPLPRQPGEADPGAGGGRQVSEACGEGPLADERLE